MGKVTDTSRELYAEMPSHTCPSIDRAKQMVERALEGAMEEMEALRDANSDLRSIAERAISALGVTERELEENEDRVTELEAEVEELKGEIKELQQDLAEAQRAAS